LNGQDVKDAALCEAFAAVAGAQANTALSYFEFGTLAVFWLMKQAEIAVAVLEVGLGGRLDAVNAVDAHAVLITSIGLDHQDWLGNDRESIGYEKAGIMRRARPAICNDLAAPASIAAQAEACGAELISHGRDYSYSRAQDSWNWRGLGESLNELPCPAITGQIYTHNAAGVLALLVRLRKQLRWKSEDFKAALRLWAVPGRAQRLNIAGREVWLDVAHNREAADGLSATLRDNPPKGRSVAVLAALKGKPVAQIMTALAPVVDMWQLAGLPDTARGLRKHELVEFARASSLQWQAHDKVAQAWAEALAQTRPGDRLIVLGSFHTVQAVLEEINRKETHNG
ncbi:MAG: bifunctional folylpolyglutamate synthase/dihydrofolate synthase, partial [Nevskiales bacterium]